MPSITLPLVAYSALGLMAVGGAVGTYGAIQAGDAAKGSANYNAKVAQRNSAVSQENATIASQSGEAQAGIQGQKTKATVGAITANQGASGVDIGSGSATDVRSSARELGELDALTIRSNAAREAYGYQVQGKNQEAQGTLDIFEGKAAKAASYVNAGSTFLGAAGQATSEYGKYLQAGTL